MKNPVILFDGVCNFCDGAVQFIIKRDRSGVFRFGALQSEAGREILLKHGLPADHLDSLVLVDEGRVYMRSTAALRIARRLRWPWPIFYGLMILPRFLRDPVYDWIGRNRYKWFGEKAECMIPSPEVRGRFL
ncbi:MAG: thiol-disulfide oxidoreductase DCC family protein [Bradymonadia bacterium]